MSRLEFYSRPLIAFDPSNKNHREWYYEFTKYRGWGKCPVRFICPDVSGMNLVTMIQQQMIEYYVSKEFNRVPKAPQKTVAQKRKKTVDKRPKK
jgi:hypothetical protein